MRTTKIFSKLVQRKGNGLVKIVAGLRRCSKSFPLSEYIIAPSIQSALSATISLNCLSRMMSISSNAIRCCWENMSNL